MGSVESKIKYWCSFGVLEEEFFWNSEDIEQPTGTLLGNITISVSNIFINIKTLCQSLGV